MWTSNAVVVNRAFVRRVLGNREPIGRRIRYRDVRDTEDGPNSR